MQSPTLLKGNISRDSRGSVSYINSFDFTGVKRFYVVENADTTIVRGFHGHMQEAKYIFVVSGTALICYVPLDSTTPSKKQKVQQAVLSADNPQILYIPPGFANGIKAFDSETKILIFSTSTLSESQKDDVRFPYDYWGKNVWRIHEKRE